MASGVKTSTLFSPLVIFMLSFSDCVVPVTGFALKNSCRVSFDVAICTASTPKLKDVPQDIPPTVKGFDLSSNNISRIRSSDFKNLQLLENLDLKNNNIFRVDEGAFAHLIFLKRLSLSRNKLSKLDTGLFDGLKNLTELRVSGNRITAVTPRALKALESLIFLDISNNKLDEKTWIQLVLQLPNLQELVMAKNKMRAFQWENPTNTSLQLKYLDLSSNPIKTFKIAADILPNLTWLNLRGTFSQHIIWDVRTFLRGVSTLDISTLRLGLGEVMSLLASFNSSLTALRMNQVSCCAAELINASCSIPTLSKLQLRDNKFKSINSGMFHLCGEVTELDLANNKIDSIDPDAFRSMSKLKILTLSGNNLQSVQAATRNLTTLVELDLSKNKISALGCEDFTLLTKLRQLNLYSNLISTLPDCTFKDLIRLQVLKLQNNSIHALNKAFKKHLPNLQKLHLNSNKLTTIKYGDFRGLQSLQNLSLHSNQIKKLENGSFIGLTNLTDLKLQLNQLLAAEIDGVFHHLINLRWLNLMDNRIKYTSSRAVPHPPFHRLSRLETLAISSQHRRGKSQLPCNILEGLPNLTDFTCRNSQLLSLATDMFTHTPNLQKLDISSNDFTDLSPELFHPIPDVRSLYISRISLRSLDFLKNAKLNKLDFLQSRRNTFSVISEDVFNALPELDYVDFQSNSFTCDCDNAWFLQWAKTNNRTQVFDAFNFECNYPLELKGKKLLDLDTQSCILEIDFICFISTTCTILLFMAASFTYHLLRWQLAYAYYFLLAMLVDRKYKNQQTRHQYDAFVSYNTHDELWVMRNLLPNLEEEQGWKLCLHHRDFEPGTVLTFTDRKVTEAFRCDEDAATEDTKALALQSTQWRCAWSRVDLWLFQVNPS